MRTHATQIFTLAAGLLFLGSTIPAQVNGAGAKSHLGWSSFSQQTLNGGFLTQSNMFAQSAALKLLSCRTWHRLHQPGFGLAGLLRWKWPPDSKHRHDS